MEILNGKEMAISQNEQTKELVALFKNKHQRAPKLVAILVGEDPASKIYVASKQKKCAELGIESSVLHLESSITEKQLIGQIEKLNQNNEVDAILLQLPLPQGLDENKITNTISPNKDVDGLTFANLGKVVSNNHSLAPCTAKGVLKMLENEDLTGKNVVVIGRSLLVGKPTAIMLSNKNATVTLCHSKTNNLQKHIDNADIVVVAVGKPKFITKVKKGAIVVDVGINRTENGIVGDVDFEKVSKLAQKISPVPGGVGPLTISNLMANTLVCAERNVIQNK